MLNSRETWQQVPSFLIPVVVSSSPGSLKLRVSGGVHLRILKAWPILLMHVFALKIEYNVNRLSCFILYRVNGVICNAGLGLSTGVESSASQVRTLCLTQGTLQSN